MVVLQKEGKPMKESTIRFYKVTAMCGHVGKRHYVPVNLAVIASSGKEAARRTRSFPRVKHNKKDAILQCSEVSEEEYRKIRAINDSDPYLNARSRYDIEGDESILSRVLPYENRDYEDEEPLSESYRRYKREGRYLLKGEF